MNIYLRELKAHRKSLIIWSVAMIFLILASMNKFSALTGGDANVNELMKSMPKSLQGLMGIGIFDMTKIVDYTGVMFLYIALVAAVHAVMLGAGIIGKEERDKTVEFLMTKPVSRSKIITAKLLSAFTMIVILNIVTTLSTYMMLAVYSKGEPYLLALFKLMASLFALQLIFAALGAFCAAFVGKPKLSSSVSTGILLLTFVLSIVVDIATNLSFLRYLSPFQYYDAKDILKGGFEASYPIVTAVLVVLFVFGTYYFYKKRDLKV